MNTRAQNPLTISVSETKQQSLKKQHEIIGYALDIFCTEPSERNRSALKHDALELVRMLDDLSNDLPRKTSRFNVLNEAKQLIAERVTFDQAKQYQGCIVKFAGMSEVSA